MWNNVIFLGFMISKFMRNSVSWMNIGTVNNIVISSIVYLLVMCNIFSVGSDCSFNVVVMVFIIMYISDFLFTGVCEYGLSWIWIFKNGVFMFGFIIMM